MTADQKISHLLRRFGLGAGKTELEKYKALGVDGTIDRLVNYEKVPDNYPVSVWELFFQQDGKWNLDPTRVRSWWQLKMLVTDRPLEEKLTVFWHNHFAVSGSKVDFGPSMFQYLTVLRQNATGGFYNLLEAVSKTPAMLHWLDTDLSVPGHPNENFAREVMELFTLGIGNYTEKDIQEAARAYVGWGIRYPFYERVGGADQKQKIMDAIERKYPLIAFSFTPDMCDRGQKTILGKTMDFTGEDVLKMLAYHPITAKRTMAKLWSYLAYENPEPALVDRLVRVWNKNDLHLKPVLMAIAHSNEFWSQKCMEGQVKSPVDYTIGLLRQFGAGQVYMARRATNAQPTDSLLPALGGDLGQLARVMKNQGLDLLYPPDVSGWKWGSNWITAATIIDRIRVQELLFNGRGKDGPLARPAMQDLIASKTTKKSADAIAYLLEIMDVQLPPEKSQVLVAELDAMGGPAQAFSNANTTAASLKKVCKVLFSAPEFQMC